MCDFQGHPFMESLAENKPLLYSVMASGGAILALAMGIVPDIANQFEIVDFPPDVSLLRSCYCVRVLLVVCRIYL